MIQGVTGRSEPAIRNGLAKPADDTLFGRVRGVCGGDTALAERIRPFTNLIRTDAWDDPIVYRDNSFMVTLGADRRETGTHYTPKSLTESIVTTTLEPVVYVGPAEGKPREEWALKPSREILDLKVCDPAMGSGAFLVQACRYLGEKLVEAWLHEEAAGKAITVDGAALDQLGAEEPLPSQLDERLTIARRLVAERCLYGVDINPLAVELAKLSIWLVTLARGGRSAFSITTSAPATACWVSTGWNSSPGCAWIRNPDNSTSFASSVRTSRRRSTRPSNFANGSAPPPSGT